MAKNVVHARKDTQLEQVLAIYYLRNVWGVAAFTHFTQKHPIARHPIISLETKASKQVIITIAGI